MHRLLPLCSGLIALVAATPCAANPVRATAIARASAIILPGSVRVTDGRLSVVANEQGSARSGQEVYAGPPPRSRACTATGAVSPPCRLIEYSLP